MIACHHLTHLSTSVTPTFEGHSQGQHTCTTVSRSWIKGALVLEVVLGLTWAFGLAFVNEQTVVFAYIFTILNSLQGTFIFVFHCVMNDKVTQQLYNSLLCCPLFSFVFQDLINIAHCTCFMYFYCVFVFSAVLCVNKWMNEWMNRFVVISYLITS